jgi:hypothetical protein
MHADLVRAIGLVDAKAGDSVVPFAAFAFAFCTIATPEGEAALPR